MTEQTPPSNGHLDRSTLSIAVPGRPSLRTLSEPRSQTVYDLITQETSTATWNVTFRIPTVRSLGTPYRDVGLDKAAFDEIVYSTRPLTDIWDDPDLDIFDDIFTR